MILTHQLRRRFQSGRIRGSSLLRFVAPSRRMACFCEVASLWPESLRFLNFHGPSWVDLLRAAWSPWGGNRPRKGEPTLPAPLADWSGLAIRCVFAPRGSSASYRASIACRRRSDLPSLPVPPVVADFPKRLGLPSRSPAEYAHHSESRKAESSLSSLWITGISRITVASSRLPFCSSLPKSDACPNPLLCLLNPRTSPALTHRSGRRC